MDDRELLELAAKAAGIGPILRIEDESVAVIGPAKMMRHWSPLTDDGDALRLAVQCQIMVFPPKEGFAAACTDMDEVDEWEEVLVGDDPCAATRRAIVRAAANIGRAI